MTSRILANLRTRLDRVRSDRIDAPARAGDSIAVYVEDSAQLADTIAAFDDARRVMANPMDEVRAWLVADLHAMGRPALADRVARYAEGATVLGLSSVFATMPGDVLAMLSPHTRAALGIGG